MASFTIDIDLDDLGGKALKLPNVDKIILKALQDGYRDFAEQAEQRLLLELELLGLGDSKLSKTITMKITETGLSIITGGEYATFIEYGTGIVGRDGTQHKHLPSYWVHDSKGHGDNGWWYPSSPNDPNPTAYYSKNQGRWIAWTLGQESRPFMYNLWLWGRQSATQIIQKHIHRSLRELERRFYNG